MATTGGHAEIDSRVRSAFTAFWRKSKLARWKLVGLLAPSEALTELLRS
jgi:hypothetical protein